MVSERMASMKRVGTLAIIGVVLAAACGSPEAGAPSAAATSPGVRSAESDRDRQRGARSTPEPTPGAVALDRSPPPQTSQSVRFSVRRCSVDGPPLASASRLNVIGGITEASDGSIYLIDSDFRVRRYLAATGDECVLSMDSAFGEDGRLTIDSGVGRRPESISSDDRGHVYVSSALGGTTRLTGRHVDYSCDTLGTVVVSPDGTTGFSNFPGSVRQVAFTDDGCTSEDWIAYGLLPWISAISFVDATHVLVAGHRVGSSDVLRVYSTTGTPEGEAFGEVTGSISAPDRFCHVEGMFTDAGGNLVVYDGGCRAIRVLDRERRPVSMTPLIPLIGLSNPWFSSLASPRAGRAYLTVSHPRDRSPETHEGHVFRVNGF